MYNHLYWIGIRKSDLFSIEPMYKGSITLFGDGEEGNIALYNGAITRKNHNMDLVDFKNFYINSIRQICNKDNEAKFMFYNPQMAYFLEEALQKKTICLNDQKFMQLLDDKLRCKLWLKNTVPVLENVQMLGSEICIDNLQKVFFAKTEFVIQSAISSGGYGTFLLNKRTQSYINKKINALQLYSISPYYNDAIPVNIHCVIYKKEIHLYPISIQIIKENTFNIIYRGCDFIAATFLSQDIQDKIKFYSKKICKKMQSCGYLGVCGIDFMIINNKIYFSEINARFQYSTSILNLGLIQNGFLSINQATIDAFIEKTPVTLPESEINCHIPYSSYTYEEEKNDKKFNSHIYKKYFSAYPEFCILKDGYTLNEHAEKGTYLFRTIFSHSIVGIFNNELRLNELLTGYSILNPQNEIQIKTMLMTFGVEISSEALSYISQKGNLRNANFSALDIIIGNIVVNAPYHINNTEYSPFVIVLEKSSLVLYYFDIIISEVDVYFESKLNNKKTSKGISYSSVAFLATDRLRINYNPICYYKKSRTGCIFCNLPDTNETYFFDDILEIVKDYIQNEDFRHILIGGGSNCYNDDCQNIFNLVEILKDNTEKPIYLMSTPPKDMNIIKEFYNLGINEIAFNMEVYDDVIAQQYMPGKANISRTQYLNALDYAVKLWGTNGNVRSMLILGLEPEESFLDGVKTLCTMGVQPMISIFRPMPNTPLENWEPFPINKMLKIYNKAKKICDYYGQILGPSCVLCQNNTLSIPENIIHFRF